MKILDSGSCEPLKASVHAGALGLFAIMSLYNAAAFLRRREPHNAVNAVLYGVATVWEHKHVSRHLAACRKAANRRPVLVPTDATEDAA
jgi:hypothetical protein